MNQSCVWVYEKCNTALNALPSVSIVVKEAMFSCRLRLWMYLGCQFLCYCSTNRFIFHSKITAKFISLLLFLLFYWLFHWASCIKQHGCGNGDCENLFFFLIRLLHLFYQCSNNYYFPCVLSEARHYFVFCLFFCAFKHCGLSIDNNIYKKKPIQK